MKRFFVFLSILTTCLMLDLFVSCYEPSPLYGSWDDGTGNTVMFMSDGTFSMNVTVNNTALLFSGDYSVLENTISFSFTNPTTGTSDTINSQWDLVGSILILNNFAFLNTTTDQYELVNMKFYHISK